MDPAGLIAALPLGAMLIGADGRIEAANARLRDLFGKPLVGRDHVTALRRPELLDAIETARQTGRVQTARLLQRRSNADLVWQVTIAPIAKPQTEAQTYQSPAVPPEPALRAKESLPPQPREAMWLAASDPSAPEPPTLLVSFEDVTPLEAAEQMRRDFIANVSHELKSPLTAMLGFIETLQGPAREDAVARARFLTIMQTEAQRMNRLVMDLLSLSRVEAEERLRPQAKLALGALIQRSTATLKATISEQGATLELDLPAQEVFVPGDQDQLQQVLSNLIENALKYGRPGGKISLRLTAPAFDPLLGRQAATISVEDEGEGIDPFHLPRLTERFYRVDTHRSRQSGGTGLGLAIVKHIISRHRGRLVVESELRRGSKFSVLLPLGVTPAAQDDA